MKRFEELRIWQDARGLVRDVYSFTSELKDYAYNDQIRRAAISIMNNIAEGADSGSDALFFRYLNIAKGSCGEVKSMLYLAEDLGYCSCEYSLTLREKVKGISAAIHKLQDYLKRKE